MSESKRTSHKCDNDKCGVVYFQESRHFFRHSKLIGYGYQCPECGTRFYLQDFRNGELRQIVYTEDYVRTLQQCEQSKQEPMSSSLVEDPNFYNGLTLEQLESKRHLWSDMPERQREAVEYAYYRKSLNRSK